MLSRALLLVALGGCASAPAPEPVPRSAIDALAAAVHQDPAVVRQLVELLADAIDEVRRDAAEKTNR